MHKLSCVIPVGGSKCVDVKVAGLLCGPRGPAGGAERFRRRLYFPHEELPFVGAGGQIMKSPHAAPSGGRRPLPRHPGLGRDNKTLFTPCSHSSSSLPTGYEQLLSFCVHYVLIFGFYFPLRTDAFTFSFFFKKDCISRDWVNSD